MATFIMAMQIIQGAKKSHPDLSHQINESIEVFATNHIKVNQLFATLGRYDFIALFDVEDQHEAFKIASEINDKGVLDTETWPVIPYEDFSEILK